MLLLPASEQFAAMYNNHRESEKLKQAMLSVLVLNLHSCKLSILALQFLPLSDFYIVVEKNQVDLIQATQGFTRCSWGIFMQT